MPSVYSHFLPVLGIVSGNDTGAGKKENPVYKLHKFACLWGGERCKFTHHPLSIKCFSDQRGCCLQRPGKSL